MTEKTGEHKKYRRKWINTTYRGPERRVGKRITFLILWVILFALIFYRFVMSSCIVEGDSMAPTLKVGSYHLVNRAHYFFYEPRRGDIIVLLKKSVFPFYLIKRIVGLPGDKVSIRFGRVYINGKKLDEPYAAGRTNPNMKEITLRRHEYFVLGDNREVADDSRFWGPVHRQDIVGKLFTQRG